MANGSLAHTQNFPQLTTLRGIHLVIFREWMERPKVGRELFRVYDSTQYREHSQTVGGVSTMAVKAEGAPIDYDTLVEGFNNTYTHVDYAKGLRATRNQMRDELYGVMDDQGAELGFSAHATEETILANHFNRAFSGSYTGPDGQSLCSTAHVRENGETYRNRLSSDADLSQTSVEQMIIDFRDQRSGGGLRLQIAPKKILVAADNVMEVQRILKSNYSPEDDTNAINPLTDYSLQPCVWDYLTDADAFFMLAEERYHHLLMYLREDFWTEHIYDFDTKDYKISGMFSMSSGWGDPRGIYGSAGA